MASPVRRFGSGRISTPPPLTRAASNPVYLWITKRVFRLVLVRAIAFSVPLSDLGVLTFSVLEPTEAISELWPYNFKLAYVVTLAAHQLSTDLHILNGSGQHIDFQTLLHTYYAVNAATAKVTPLTGLTYLNKVNGGVEETEQRHEVDVTSFTDSVYKDAVSKSAGKYKITDGNVIFELHTRGFKDLVVWNPSQEAGSKIGDMESGGWSVTYLLCIKCCINQVALQGEVHMRRTGLCLLLHRA
jgi:D-hexose-6-phosphate mutarotase